MILSFARPMKHVLLIALAAASLSGCSTASKLFSSTPASAEAPVDSNGIVQAVQKSKLFGVVPVYRPDIQQGNFISKEMVAQLKVGMTPEQVRFVLGTPLLTDLFHETRWDYPFRIRKGDGVITSSRVVVFFKEGRVSHFEGGDLPEENDYLLRIAAPQNK
jgi:outer membrane protein assembly factor BamE